MAEPSGEVSAPSRRLRTALVVEQLRRPVPGGIGRFAVELLGGLCTLTPAPDVTTLAIPAPAGRPDALAAVPFPNRAAGGRLLSALTRVPALAGLGDPVVTRLWARGLLGVGGGFDLVHSVSLAAPPTGATPLTVMVHDVAWRQVPEAYPPGGLAWHEAALRRAARSARAVVVPSATVARELLAASVELDATRVTVIPEGCDHLGAPDESGARELLRRLGVEGEYLLTVSTIEPRKNLRRLLDAYRQLRPQLPEPWPLLVVGPTGWGSELEGGEGVVRVGQVSDSVLSALYAGARVAIYVPLAEGFGLPAVEALAAGAPLLASSGVPSIVEHASPAVVVDPRSTEAIGRALGELATDDRRREELALAGPLSVRPRTWRAAALRHVEWWAEVAGP